MLLTSQVREVDNNHVKELAKQFNELVPDELELVVVPDRGMFPFHCLALCDIAWELINECQNAHSLLLTLQLQQFKLSFYVLQ